MLQRTARYVTRRMLPQQKWPLRAGTFRCAARTHSARSGGIAGRRVTMALRKRRRRAHLFLPEAAWNSAWLHEAGTGSTRTWKRIQKVETVKSLRRALQTSGAGITVGAWKRARAGMGKLWPAGQIRPVKLF